MYPDDQHESMTKTSTETESTAMTRREWLGRLPLPAVATAVGAALMFHERHLEAQTIQPRSVDTDSNDSGARVYNIRTYGAKGDGATLDSAALQSAVDACHADGGGTVLVPSGRFLIGSTELKSNVSLHIVAGGTLLGIGDGREYPPVDAVPLEGDATMRDGNRALLYAVGATNIRIEGAGTIDGQGSLFFPTVPGLPGPSKPGDLRRPYHLMFYRCERIVLRDLTLVDCAYHSVRVIQSRRLHIDNIYMYNHKNVNCDGFHFISAEHVTLSNCTIYVQDDACAMFGSSRFITITNCFFSTRWSVFRFGGGIAEDITVSNCICKQVYGCPIKFQGNEGSRFQNISFSNLLLDDVTGPIYISIGTESGRPVNPGLTPNMPAAPMWPPTARNISFSHIRGTVTTNPGQFPDMPPASNPGRPGERFSCITLNAVGNAVMENISFSDIHLTFGGGGSADAAGRRELPNVAGEYFVLGAMPAYGFYARNSRGITLDNVRLEIITSDLRPALILDHVQDVAIRGLQVQGDPASESVLRFVNTKDVLLTATRLLTPAAVFLQVEGTENSNIKAAGSDLSKAKVPLAFNDGASEKMVRFEQ
jgi:polygalacturonase